MGTHRSRHNRGRKPKYKEHRENICGDSSISDSLTGSSDLALVRLNMLGEKLSGSDLVELSDKFVLRKSSETPTLARRIDADQLGAKPKTKNSENFTQLEKPSVFWHSTLIPAKSACAARRESLGLDTELTIRLISNPTWDDGPSVKSD